MGALQVNYRMFVDVRNENTGKIVAKQNDTKTRYLDITVTDNGVPVDLTGCEVRIYGRKKDGTEFYNDGTLQDAENGRCLFEATTQMLAYAGQNVNCEIVVFKDNEQILSTMPFEIFVVESLMGESAIESSNEYGALVILYQNLYEAIDLMTTMVQNIGSPSTVAEQYNLETMWQAWEFLADYMKTDLTQMIENALANASVSEVLERIGQSTDTAFITVFGWLYNLFENQKKDSEWTTITAEPYVLATIREGSTTFAAGTAAVDFFEWTAQHTGAVTIGVQMYVKYNNTAAQVTIRKKGGTSALATLTTSSDKNAYKDVALNVTKGTTYVFQGNPSSANTGQTLYVKNIRVSGMYRKVPRVTISKGVEL